MSSSLQYAAAINLATHNAVKRMMFLRTLEWVMFDPPDTQRVVHQPNQIPFLRNGARFDDMTSQYHVSLDALKTSLKGQLPETVIRVFRVPHSASKR